MTTPSRKPTPTARMLERALAAEHAAVFAYGIVGARTSGSARDAASDALDDHRDRRDQLTRTIKALGGDPPAALAEYRLPFEVTSATAALRFAVFIEERVTAAYLELAAAGSQETRKFAAQLMQECTTRLYGWRQRQQPDDRKKVPALPGYEARK